MSPDPFGLSRQLRRLYSKNQLRQVSVTPVAGATDFTIYHDDPVGFGRDVLGIDFTEEQQAIARALPGRVKVEAGHSVGKTHLMAALLLWWVYTRIPSVVICNAPSRRAVEDTLWVEVRLLWQRAKIPLPDYFVGPKAAEMYHTPDHWAKGYTTSSGEGYQGRHRENMLFLFDEDEGIDAIYWTTTNTMYQPDGGHAWLTCCNPVTTSSRSSQETYLTDADGNKKWKLFTLDSTKHPNIQAQLRGEKPPIPNAVTLGQVNDWVRDWTTPLFSPADRLPGDVEWPPGSNKWFRPGPIFKARVQGIRPTSGIDTVWSMDAFDRCLSSYWDVHDCWRRGYGITVGVDSAAFGDDDTCIHVRCGPASVHHESHNGWGPDRTAARLKELCGEWANWYNGLSQTDRPPISPYHVKVIIEQDGGYGVGVMSHRREYYNWVGITVGGESLKFDSTGRKMYLNLRAELWIESARKGSSGLIDFSRLDPEAQNRLRRQLTAPCYEVCPDGSRKVERREDIKERIGRSPDDATAVIVSHYDPPEQAARIIWGNQGEP